REGDGQVRRLGQLDAPRARVVEQLLELGRRERRGRGVDRHLLVGGQGAGGRDRRAREGELEARAHASRSRRGEMLERRPAVGEARERLATAHCAGREVDDRLEHDRVLGDPRRAPGIRRARVFAHRGQNTRGSRQRAEAGRPVTTVRRGDARWGGLAALARGGPATASLTSALSGAYASAVGIACLAAFPEGGPLVRIACWIWIASGLALASGAVAAGRRFPVRAGATLILATSLGVSGVVAGAASLPQLLTPL